MNSDTKKTVGTMAATAGVVAAVFIGAGNYAKKELAAVVAPPATNRVTLPPQPPALRLTWSKPLDSDDVRAGWVTEFYGTTNLKDFYYSTNTTTNRIALPATKGAEYFISRHRNTNTGHVTPWNTKP